MACNNFPFLIGCAISPSGPQPQWGEHEIDYILLCQRPRGDIEETLQLNPNEVEDVLWLDHEQCRDFVENKNGNKELISPWFGAIERELLHPWWEALRNGQEVEPDGRIHRLDGGEEAIRACKS